MKRCIALTIGLLTCLLMFAGCSCKHDWVEADCATAKTCSKCHATEGEPLGHTFGKWKQVPDAVAATLSKVQHCTACNERIVSETVPLDTMIQNGLFLFTPNEFMERFSVLADQYVEEFSYEFVSNNGLAAFIYADGKQSILQFFRKDATLLATDEKDVAEVWCVSLTEIGEADVGLRNCFFVVCDPMLNENTAGDLDMELSVAYLNALSAGQTFGYYQNNGLLYENTHIFQGSLGQAYSMELVNIYASDFR